MSCEDTTATPLSVPSPARAVRAARQAEPFQWTTSGVDFSIGGRPTAVDAPPTAQPSVAVRKPPLPRWLPTLPGLVLATIDVPVAQSRFAACAIDGATANASTL